MNHLLTISFFVLITFAASAQRNSTQQIRDFSGVYAGYQDAPKVPATPAQHVRSRIDTLHCNFWFKTKKATDTIFGGYMLNYKMGSWSTRYAKDTIIFTDSHFLRMPATNPVIGYKAIPK